MTKRLLVIATSVFAVGVGPSQVGIIQSFTGDLRTDATFISCGSGCTLDAGNSDSDHAQWAAVERDFTVPVSSMVQAISFSYGGGTNGNGQAIAPGGFEPCILSRSLPVHQLLHQGRPAEPAAEGRLTESRDGRKLSR